MYPSTRRTPNRLVRTSIAGHRVGVRIGFEILDFSVSCGVVRIVAIVLDRDTGKERRIDFAGASRVDGEVPTDPHELALFLHRYLLDFIAHEVAEGITIDGVRVLDPHG